MRYVLGLTAAVCLCLTGAAQADDKAQQELLDKAVQAAGGADKLAKLQQVNWKAKGSHTEGGVTVEFSMDSSSKGFDKHRMEAEVTVNGMSMKGTLVINGDMAWAHFQGKTEEAPKEAIDIVKNLFHALRGAQMLTPLKDKAYKLAALGEVKLGDRPVVGLKVSREGYRDLDLFFDKQTGLPAKMAIRLPESPNGQEMEFEFLFENFKDFGGIKHFTTMTVQQGGNKKFTLEVSDIKPQDKLDDNAFGKP